MSYQANYYVSKKINIEYFQILFISFFFAFLVGNGLYGFGTDFYDAYYKPNFIKYNATFADRLGWMLSTLTIFKFHLGVYLVSFLLAISTGLLLVKTTYRYFEKNRLVFFTCYIMLLHTWPIIMSTSNAMRQGLSMSFLFIALYFLLSKKYVWYLVSIVLVVMTHKIGIFLALLLTGGAIYNNQIQKWSNSLSTHRNLLIVSGVLFAIFLYILISVVFNNLEASYIISGDYRYPFLVINMVYIFIYMKYLFINSDHIDIFLLVCSFIFPVFLFHGFNWQFERLNMIILIPYMISFSRVIFILDKKHTLFFPPKLLFFSIFLFSIIFLLFMTVYAGMYEALK